MANPVLEHVLVYDGISRACVVIRERIISNAQQTQQIPTATDPALYVTKDMQRWHGEFIMINMRASVVQVRAGCRGTAPLYLAARGRALDGSWDLPSLRHHMNTDQLLDRAVVRALTRHHRYTTDTFFSTVHRLTERASATFTATDLVIDYPPPALHVVRSRTLRTGVDPVAAFDTLLTTIVKRVPAPHGGTSVELSGGADSANVALAVTAAQGHRVDSFGLVVDGDIGAAQQYRRTSLTRALGLRDTALYAHDYPPFWPGGFRASGRPHDPASAFYQEAFNALRDRAADAGTHVIFTGLGGDEAMALHPYEYTATQSAPEEVPWLGTRAKSAMPDIDANLAPPGPVHLPTMMAFSLHTPAYLRRGIWPVSPLADHTVVRFSEQLPMYWRQHKRLFRERLRRAGFTRDVVEPPQPENFRALMQAGLRRHGLTILRNMLDESILIDTGFVDRRELVAAYERALAAQDVPSLLCDTIRLEVGLRSLLTSRRFNP